MRTFAAIVFILAAFALTAGARQSSSQQQSSAAAQPAFDQWADDFNAAALDETKWERFSFEGAGGGKLELKGGELHIRSMNGSRSGIRSKQSFASDKFSVEAQVARVGQQVLLPGDKSSPLGFASLTILFDGSGRNRIEWILTSEGTFEAWSVVDGRGERIDDRKLGTKIKNPILAIVRRGDEFLFVLNSPDSPPEAAQVGLKKTIKNLPRTFHVMLYGFGSSENDWNDVRVSTLK
ncbi:MAG TPA: hypothetical protein VGP08_06560 [Pyrinomonadaceae bacterium]|jgi:hypothetical protein|nr:hypothetical protein [Pyrinomonadaceae bacterium]